MGEVKRASGPWKLVQQEKWPFGLRIDSADGQQIVEMERYAYSMEQNNLAECLGAVGFEPVVIAGLQEQIANARLMAAAPELLEALEEMCSLTHTPTAKALEAIAKAKAA